VIIGSSQEQSEGDVNKIVNSQEQDKIITSKPIVRGPRKKANYEDVKNILNYCTESDEDDYKTNKGKRGLKPAKEPIQEAAEEEIPVKSELKQKRKRKADGKASAKKQDVDADDEAYNVKNDLYEKAKPVEKKRGRPKKDPTKNLVNQKLEKQLDKILDEKDESAIKISKFVDSKISSQHSLQSPDD
jgi:hypothetical protein